MNRDDTIAQVQKDIFAKNLNYYLALRGKQQIDVATHLGVTSSTVSDWANAKKYPRVDKMQVLAEFLGVLMSDLREPMENKQSSAEAEDNSDKAYVLKALANLPPEGQQAVAEYTQFLLQKYGLLPK